MYEFKVDLDGDAIEDIVSRSMNATRQASSVSSCEIKVDDLVRERQLDHNVGMGVPEIREQGLQTEHPESDGGVDPDGIAGARVSVAPSKCYWSDANWKRALRLLTEACTGAAQSVVTPDL